MRVLDKIIKSNVISLTLVTIILIVLTVFVTTKFYEMKVKNTYEIEHFVISGDKKIKTKLNKLSDQDGLKGNIYTINITNNGPTRNYKILLSPIVNNDEDIRLSFNDNIIRNLSSFDKEDNSYIIYNSYLPSSYSSLNKIKIWQRPTSTEDNISVDFNLTFKID